MSLDQVQGIYEAFEGGVPEKNQIRAWEIRMDNPRDGDPGILYRTESVMIDSNDNTVSVNDRRKTPDVTRSFSQVYADVIQFIDPVTQQVLVMSPVGLATALKIYFEKYWAEDNS